MASPFELQSFVGKFLNLWKNGCDASLFVESRAGKAFVNLRVGLGEAPPHPTFNHHGHGGNPHRDGGGPSRRRRRERRKIVAAENVANGKAGEAFDVSGNENPCNEPAEKDDGSDEQKRVAENASLDVAGSPISQMDGTTYLN